MVSESQILPLRPPPNTLPFSDDREYRYFCIFRDRTAFELSGGFDPTLWSRLVVQSCENISIRELTTAVAGLSIAGNQRNESQALQPFVDPTLTHNINSHLQYALMQYGKALKRIQEMVSTGQDSIRVALIAALLIFVIESLHGDTGRAITPIQSAQELILKRLSNMPRIYRNSRTCLNRSHGPPPIDEDLLAAYMRLDGPTMAIMRKIGKQPPYPAHRIFKLCYLTDEFIIPKGFATISEARTYLEDIKWRIPPISKDKFPIPDQRPPRYQSPDYAELFSPVDDQSQGPLTSDFSIILRALRIWYSTHKVFSAELKLQFSQWHSAFAPLLEYSMTPEGAATFIPAATLYVQALNHDLLLHGFEPTRSASDDVELIGSSQMMISFCRRLAEHPQFSKGFVFDTCVLESLVFVMILCPDRDLKWAARDVVEAMVPRREEVWDSRTILETADRTFAQEEVDFLGSDCLDPCAWSHSPTPSFARDDSTDRGLSSSDLELLDVMRSTPSTEDPIDPRLRSWNGTPQKQYEQYLGA